MGGRGPGLVMVLLAGAFAAGCGGNDDGGTSTAQLSSSQRTQLDAAIDRGLAESRAPGAVVGVQTPDGRYVRAVGVADKASNTPMTTDMYQRIGSLTKTFTAALLMQLAGEEKVSLDDPIAKYVTGVPNGSDITLRELADMTSGVASYTASPKFTDELFSNPERTWTPQELLRFGLADSPSFKPGTQFDYSNSNYVLLGLVIEQVEGKPYGDVVRERIIDPLKLTQTTWPNGTPRFPKPHAQGYTVQGQQPGKEGVSTEWNPSAYFTAGELISTIDDLLTYGHAFGTGDGLLDPAVQKERLDSFLTKPPPLSPQLSYGIGLVNDHGWIGHTGQVPGYTTTDYYFPSIDTTVVVAANSDIPAGRCPPQETLKADQISEVCATPADHIMGAIARSLGHPYELPPG